MTRAEALAKSKWALIGLPLLVAVGALVLGNRTVPSSNRLPVDSDYACPIWLSHGTEGVPDQPAIVNWKVRTIGFPIPVIEVKDDMVDGVRACSVKIVQMPNAPDQNSEWRMGHEFLGLRRFEGKSVLVTMRLRGLEAARPSFASVIVSNGEKILKQDIGDLGPDWTTVNIVVPAELSARMLGLWFQVQFGDKATDLVGSTIFFVAVLKILP